MLSKKSFWGVEQIFSEVLVRRSENDVGGHIINPISNWQPSEAPCEALVYEKPVSTVAQAKISVSSFLPFSTASVTSGHGAVNWRCPLFSESQHSCAFMNTRLRSRGSFAS
jgi:hypothetical protein